MCADTTPQHTAFVEMLQMLALYNLHCACPAYGERRRAIPAAVTIFR